MPHTRIIDGQQRHMYGWKADLPDHRDITLTASKLKAFFLPRRIDLRADCPRVENQGHLGSCTANASTSAMEFLYKKAGKKQLELSRLYLYFATRVWVAKEEPTSDDGAMIRDVMKALAKYGTCREEIWPYQPAKFSEVPPAAAKADGLNRQILHYFRCPSLRYIRTCIAAGYPCVGGFSVPDSMDSEETVRTGVVRYPDPKEDFVGGHAVLFMGYDDKTKLLTFQNSWGTSWGDKGFGYLPYAFVENLLAHDFWTIRRAEL